MAGFFKKRRTSGGPSKNDEKVKRGREAEARQRSRGRLAERFPQVDRLSVALELLSPQLQPLADKETRLLGPNDPCEFSVPCPGRCGHGSFDLAAKLEAVIEARQTLCESSGVCQEPLYADSPDVCGVRLNCRIEVAYQPETQEAQPAVEVQDPAR